jgi:hypothetical protein
MNPATANYDESWKEALSEYFGLFGTCYANIEPLIPESLTGQDF